MKQSNDSILMSEAKKDIRKFGYSCVYQNLSAAEANNVISFLKLEFPDVRLDKKTYIIYQY